MTYASNDKFAETSGLGLRVVDETVGTGGASGTQSFDLDNGNVISDTYTFNYGTAGSNELFALTETTDYVFDKEAGRMYLTDSGTSKVAQDIIYSTYTHIDAYSDGIITNLLDNATHQVDKLTGRNWDTGTATIEYQDGRRSSEYPTTDAPYDIDYDRPDSIVLKKWPVTKVDQIFFLSSPQSINKFYNYDLGSTTFTDKTTAINSSTVAPFTLFDDAPATGDIVYIGTNLPFMGLDINLSTVGVGASTIDWEYYNGSAWADITETETDTGSSIFTASGRFTWSFPYGWTKNSVNSTSLYWLKGTLTDNYTTDPICATISLKDSLSKILEPRQIILRSNGTVDLSGARLQNGQQNVRIDYTYGLDVTPTYIEELTVLIASLQAFVGISGGSYDDATGYQIGSKQIQIGEAWVNLKQVIQEIEKRKNVILDMIGRRGDISVI